MELILSPETSVNNYQVTQRNFPEEQIFNLQRGVSLKSRKVPTELTMNIMSFGM